ncbi:hypothetical protein H1C71_017082, partial [Ictidomys tridecemlineatus]
ALAAVQTSCASPSPVCVWYPQVRGTFFGVCVCVCVECLCSRGFSGLGESRAEGKEGSRRAPCLRLRLSSSALLPARCEAAAAVAPSAPRWVRTAQVGSSEDPFAEVFRARWDKMPGRLICTY